MMDAQIKSRLARMQRARVAFAMLLAIGLSSGIASPAEAQGPFATISTPADGFKLRRGRTAEVRIRILPVTGPVSGWTLRLVPPDGVAEEIAHGTSALLSDTPVAVLSADSLELGATYQLVLEAQSGSETATATAHFLVPDPQYALIPLEPGNFSQNRIDGLSVDASGNLITVGGRIFADSVDIIVVNAAAGTAQAISVPLQSSEGQKLSADGRRFFFLGGFGDPGNIFTGLLSFDLASQAMTPVVAGAEQLFSVDHTGARVAYQALDRSIGGGNGVLEYFFYDESTGTSREITTDPDAIVYSTDPTFCPQILGTTPVITADGAVVAFMTSSTLGIASEDSSVGCRIFVYQIANGVIRQVAAVPRGVVVDKPVISDDGHWLSLSSTRVVPPNIRRSFPALLDLQTGQLTDPVGGITDFPSFDSVITADGSAIVISTEANLDPRVGNADHNMDLFLYERATGKWTQISDTTGGIGQLPGHCPSYRPRVSSDGRVVAFGFNLFSGEGCQLDGPQRNAADGLAFERARAVRKRPDNRSPLLHAPLAARVLAGGQLAIDLSATDPDGDPINFFAQEADALDVPAGSVIEDHHDGTATFSWTTKPENAGVYALRVAAFDEGGGETFQDVTIDVCNQITVSNDTAGVIAALFGPISCDDADVNGDQRVSAADLVGATESAAAR